MDFNSIEDTNIHVDSEGFCIFTSDYSSKLKGKDFKILSQILDTLGELSSRAQGLKTTITTGNKFFSSDHKLYLKVVDDSVIGLLKIGVKQLFINDAVGKFKKITPICVLDFYVHESQQRSGYGKQLFEKMLKTEKITPNKIAYDRPSIKLISFLRKHYNLEKYVPQNNNFIVYDDYFIEPTPKNKTKQFDYDEFNSYDPNPRIQQKKEEETKSYVSNYHSKLNNKPNNVTPDINRNKYVQEDNVKYTSAQTNKYDKRVLKDQANDNIDDLSSKFEKININNSKDQYKKPVEINRNQGKTNTKNYPWAVDSSSSSIPSSSSSTYGAYYFSKNK